ncbi:MAG: molybdopterin cofactor-binding domain-containing protein [Myxococcota bacterium]|nr:molybdopterin cofactor-binding domain-containing protein [Myxococcota bacterium]
MESIDLQFTLDGETIERSIPHNLSTLDLLREHLGERDLRPGCSPQGVCGSCAVLVNGVFRLGCTLPARSLKGKEVLTPSSWELAESAAQAFARSGAALGGYELPGLLTQARVLHKKGQTDKAGADKGLLMHLLRGASWESVEQALAELEDPTPGPAFAADKGLGLVPFVEDLERPGMRHAVPLWTPAPRMKLEALELPELPEGCAVLDAQALGLGLGVTQAPLMPGPGEQTRHHGEILALVVAPTRAQAVALRDAIEVRGEVMEPMTSPARSRVAVGSAREESGRWAEGASTTLQTSFLPQPAGCLEAPAVLAVPHSEGMQVFANGECAGAEAWEIRELTGVEARVELLGSSAGPGGRGDLGLAVLAVAAARELDRPVKLSLELGEASRILGRRHPVELSLELSGGPEGLSLGWSLQADSGGDGRQGEAFVYPALAQAAGAYRLEGIRAEFQALQTNNPPAGGVAGDGALQTLVALELGMDALARAQDLEPLALRLALLDEASGLGPLLEQAPTGDGWSQACIALRSPGSTPAAVAVVEEEAGIRVLVDRAGAGLGWEAELRTAAAEALQLSPEQVEIEVSSDAPPSPGEDPGLLLQALRTALAAHSLDASVGHRSIGEVTSAEGYTSQRAVAAVRLVDGEIAQVWVRSHAGEMPHPRLHRSRLLAAVQEGLGAAFTEAIATQGGIGDERLRTYGLIKSKRMPPVDAGLTEGGAAVSPGAAARIAVAAACACALAKHEGRVREVYPARDCPAAWQLGIKKPRGPKTGGA